MIINMQGFTVKAFHGTKIINFHSRLYIKFRPSQWSMNCRSRAMVIWCALEENIAKSEQSSHTPGSNHQRPYHFNSLERKKNAQIKGLISNMWLNFLYTAQLVISDVCTNFQNSRSSSS